MTKQSICWMLFLSGFIFPAVLHADCYDACMRLEGCPVSDSEKNKCLSQDGTVLSSDKLRKLTNDNQGCPPAAKGFSCDKEKVKCEKQCKSVKPAAAQEDELFFGTKVQQGGTTIMQGERIPVPLAALNGGDWKPEDLEQLESTTISSTAPGSVGYTESSSQRGWIFGSSSSSSSNVNVQPGVTITRRKNSE